MKNVCSYGFIKIDVRNKLYIFKKMSAILRILNRYCIKLVLYCPKTYEVISCYNFN